MISWAVTLSRTSAVASLTGSGSLFLFQSKMGRQTWETIVIKYGWTDLCIYISLGTRAHRGTRINRLFRRLGGRSVGVMSSNTCNRGRYSEWSQVGWCASNTRRNLFSLVIQHAIALRLLRGGCANRLWPRSVAIERGSRERTTITFAILGRIANNIFNIMNKHRCSEHYLWFKFRICWYRGSRATIYTNFSFSLGGFFGYLFRFGFWGLFCVNHILQPFFKRNAIGLNYVVTWLGSRELVRLFLSLQNKVNWLVRIKVGETITINWSQTDLSLDCCLGALTHLGTGIARLFRRLLKRHCGEQQRGLAVG